MRWPERFQQCSEKEGWRRAVAESVTTLEAPKFDRRHLWLLLLVCGHPSTKGTLSTHFLIHVGVRLWKSNGLLECMLTSYPHRDYNAMKGGGLWLTHIPLKYRCPSKKNNWIKGIHIRSCEHTPFQRGKGGDVDNVCVHNVRGNFWT